MNLTTFNYLLPGATNDLFEFVVEQRHALKKSHGGSVAIVRDELRQCYYFAPEWVKKNTSKLCTELGGSQMGGMHISSVNNIESSEENFRYGIPWFILDRPNYGHYVYQISFGPRSEEAKETLDHPSFSPLIRGYVGMTSRNPLSRFKEHKSKVNSGEGFALHNAWRSLVRSVPDVIPVFRLIAVATSRSEAFDFEEKSVTNIGTLLPDGLNVVPGGMAGVRELWKLGLMSPNEKATPDSRDAALERLEVERSPVTAHYRRGHVRKLAAKCKLETTWVNPCWVGLYGIKGAA